MLLIFVDRFIQLKIVFFTSNKSTWNSKNIFSIAEFFVILVMYNLGVRYLKVMKQIKYDFTNKTKSSKYKV